MHQTDRSSRNFLRKPLWRKHFLTGRERRVMTHRRRDPGRPDGCFSRTAGAHNVTGRCADFMPRSARVHATARAAEPGAP